MTFENDNFEKNVQHNYTEQNVRQPNDSYKNDNNQNNAQHNYIEQNVRQQNNT